MLLYDDHQTPDRRAVVQALAFSPDGVMLASGATDGAVVVHDPDGNADRPFEPGPQPAEVHSVGFLPGGALVVGHQLGWECYRRAAGGWQQFGPAAAEPTTALAVLDANTLAVGTGKRGQPAGKFQLWDLKADRRVEPYFFEPNGVRAVVACPGKGLVAWATGHKELRVWDVRRPGTVKFHATHSSPALALAPDGSALVAAVDWTARVFDLGKRQERAVLKGHKGIVSAVAVSPDSSTIATGSWDATVRLWDATSGRERAAFTWPVGKVYSLAYAPDGLRLAAGGDSGAVVVWDMD